MESFMNFYIGLGAFYITDQKSGTSKDGFEFDLFLGSEFFIKDLPNLGFSFEFGGNLDTLDDIQIQTYGATFLSAGIHYYF